MWKRGLYGTIVVGDFSAIVGEGKEDAYIGHYGLGYRNDHGQTLVDFCTRRQMYIANTKGNINGLAMFRDMTDFLHDIIEVRLRGKPTKWIQMLHDLANDGGYVALRRAVEDRKGWSHRKDVKNCFTAEDY